MSLRTRFKSWISSSISQPEVKAPSRSSSPAPQKTPEPSASSPPAESSHHDAPAPRPTATLQVGSTDHRRLSFSGPFENEARALMNLVTTQCQIPLQTVITELLPIPCIQIVVSSLTEVFKAVERAKVNREQWKLLQGRVVMVCRIAGAQVTNYGGRHYPNVDIATNNLNETILHIAERASYYNDLTGILAFVEFQAGSDEIRRHFASLDSCLTLFSYATDVAQNHWIGEFDAVQRQELAQLSQMRTLLDDLKLDLDLVGQNQEKIMKTTTESHDLLRQVVAEKLIILQNQSSTSVENFYDAQRIVQTIRTVTGIQLPPELLAGKHCKVDSTAPIKAGLTCDIYSGSFLTDEKVAKKVFRLGISEEEHVKRYAERFLRDAKLWAEFKSHYTLPFYGIGMESFDGNQHFQLYMLSPLMKNFDAVTYLKQHRRNPNIKDVIMRILTDAARGLQYLHHRDPPVVHSGMRGDNILITDSGGATLGGFGLTKALLNATGGEQVPQVVMTGKTESQRWMAPEMLNDFSVLQTPADIWGWGMAALELLSGQVPYYQLRQPHLAPFDIRAGRLPARSDYREVERCAIDPDAMWSLLERCWAMKPEERPTIDGILDELKRISGGK